MRKYQFCVNQYARDYNGVAPQEVAKLVQVSNDHTALIFYYSKGFCKRTGYPLATQSGMVNGAHAAFMDDDYKKLLYEKTLVFEAVAFHELGHIEKGHLTTKVTDKSVRQSRKAFGRAGLVDPWEIEADAFAASEIGAKRMIEALTFLIEKRKKSTDMNASIAINEMRARISYLENIEK